MRRHDRILTTHAGSLPRVPALEALHRRRARAEPVAQDEFAAAADAAVREIIRRQIDVGIDIGNDGEQRRRNFARYIEDRLSGLGGGWRRPPRGDVEDFPLYKQMTAGQRGGAPELSPQVVGAVRHVNAAAPDRECAGFLDALAQAGGGFADSFITAPSPGFLASTMQNVHYDTEQAYFDALSDALQVEYEAIARHGVMLQIDCPDIGVESGRLFLNRPRHELLAFIDKGIDAINRAVRNIPPERIRLHVCWGNVESPRVHDAPLQDILPAVLRANVGAIMFPFANGRHAHEIQVLRAIPLRQDQIVLAGVIDTLTNVVEHPEVVADRLERVAAVVGDARRVVASTDCGLETSVGGSRVAPDVAWAKLAVLVEGARLASRRLKF